MINVKNLDLGYEQCRDLYTTVNKDGENLLQNIKSVYDGLRTHWKGTDATLHVNQLVSIHTFINSFIADTANLVAGAAEKIVQVQEVRKANGSSGLVGELLGEVSEKEKLSKIDETTEYSCSAEAKNDYQLLTQVCTEFDSFVEKVHNKSDELMNNWVEGNEREKVVKSLQDFEALSEEYKGYLSETRNALDIAISNLSQIM